MNSMGDLLIKHDLVNRINSLLEAKEKVIVAIEGNSGAGKSTLAGELAKVFDLNLFHMDDFFLTPDLRTPERLSEVGGNVDYVRFGKEVIENLKRGHAFSYRRYDCSKKEVGDCILVSPRKLNVIEGSYSMHPYFTDIYDFRIFMHADEVKQRERILKRNGPILFERFINEWIPMENRYFKEFRIMEKSDLVIET